jgi:hypothetical protein
MFRGALFIRNLIKKSGARDKSNARKIAYVFYRTLVELYNTPCVHTNVVLARNPHSRVLYNCSPNKPSNRDLKQDTHSIR